MFVKINNIFVVDIQSFMCVYLQRFLETKIRLGPTRFKEKYPHAKWGKRKEFTTNCMFFNRELQNQVILADIFYDNADIIRHNLVNGLLTCDLCQSIQ